MRKNLTPARAAKVMGIDVMLAARAGRMADVVARTDAEAGTRLLQIRPLRLMRAWALSSLAPDENRAEVQLLLDGAKPIASGELRGIARHWPEFGAFLVANGLGDAT